MSQHLGKLSVGLAVLAVAGAIGFVVTHNDVKIKSKVLTQTPKGEAFNATLPSALPETSLGWLRGEKVEGDFWTYDLFTPVEISWMSKSNEYAPKGEADAPLPQYVDFGLRLVSISRPKYRLRISGIAEAASKAPADATIFIYDDESRGSLRGKVGETLGPKGAQVKILKYEPKQTDPKTGQLLKTASVTVKDIPLRREMTLGTAPVEFPDRLSLVFCSPSASTPVWTATAVGDKYENEAGVFTIKGVDFDGQSVTVEKSFLADPIKNKRKVISETLSPIPAEPKSELKK